MYFEEELYILKKQIDQAEDVEELNFLRNINEKKYWWTSIFITGLFYALNKKVGKMILSWVLSFFTLGIYALWIIYTSYRDQKEFNDEMENLIFKKYKQLKDNCYITAKCSVCGTDIEQYLNFCPNCGSKIENPEYDDKYCLQCGAEKIEDAKFCQECGNNFEGNLE